MNTLLLDTCAVIWLAKDEPVSDAVTQAMTEAARISEPVYISPMSAWEIGMLSARGRLTLSMDPIIWFQRILGIPGVKLADLSVRILIASSFLPGTPPRDPVDKIIAATAREGGHQLVTRDKQLLTYAEQGHIKALAC